MTDGDASGQGIACGAELSVRALPGLPVVKPGDDLAELALAGCSRAEIQLADCDVVVVASKIVSRAEGRFVDLARVEPSASARRMARRAGKDPRLVELVLRESAAISRAERGVLVVRHHLGFVSAEAGIDFSNAEPPSAEPGSGPFALLLPVDPDASAERLRRELERRTGKRLAVIVSDSHGRPFRLGSIGSAIGLSGMPALWDRRGERDLFGRKLEHTVTALGDQAAAAADLVAGQAAEGRAIVIVRGLGFGPSADSARSLCRPIEQDLYASSRGSEEEA